jgi:hypothetical protein
MFFYLLIFCAAFGLCAGMFFFYAKRNWSRRIRALERDLQRISKEMCQMAEIQLKTHEKLSKNLEHIEERIMDLAVPSNDANIPLERRHHVLSLARQGVVLDEIVKRLNAPRGEAELILNLNKFAGMKSSRKNKGTEGIGQYA